MKNRLILTLIIILLMLSSCASKGTDNKQINDTPFVDIEDNTDPEPEPAPDPESSESYNDDNQAKDMKL
jgi:protein involved in sex pheromone biosynthesis